MKSGRVALLVLLSLGVLVAPLATQAQQAGQVWRLGFLFAGTLAQRPQAEGFREGLRELGYVEGRNVLTHVREAEGRVERLNQLAEELVALSPNVMVAVTTPAVAAAKRATRQIPIVMLVVGDPVGAGFATSLARPDGNITGLSINNDELSAKRLQLVKELLPTATRIAVLWNERNPQNRVVLDRSLVAASALGMTLLSLPMRGPDNLDKVLAPVSSERPDAMVVVGDFVTFDLRATIISIAAMNRLPTLYTYPEEAADGGLIAYGPNLREHYRRGAYYVDRLIKGAKPADLPIEQPTKFDLVINLKTAKALGLTIPPSLLLRADHVIE